MISVDSGDIIKNSRTRPGMSTKICENQRRWSEE
jgi:hypothetical protein